MCYQLRGKVNELESKIVPANAMMAYGGVGVQLYPNGTRWGWISSFMPGHLTREERTLVRHWIRCWTGSRVGKDALDMWKLSFLFQKSEHDGCATHLCKLVSCFLYFFPLIFVFFFHSPCAYSFTCLPFPSFVSSSSPLHLFLSNLPFILSSRPVLSFSRP